MNNRPIGPWLSVLGCMLVVAGSVPAQYPGNGPRQGYAPPQPGYSPYLNLTRPGNPGINYYGLVRPEISFRNSLGAVQQDLNALNSPYADPTLPTNGLATGHASQFNNLSHYYGGFNRLTSGSGSRASGQTNSLINRPAAPTGGQASGGGQAGVSAAPRR